MSREIIWSKQSNSLCEIYHKGLQYAFVSEKNEQCHQFVYCKDFLQDAIQGTLEGASKSIYGFTYDPKKMPKIDLETTRLVLVNSIDNDFTKKLPNVVEFINQFEKHLHLKRTVGYVVSNPGKYKTGALYFESSGRWLNAPPMLSLYTLLLRTGFVHKTGTSWETTVNGVVSGKIAPYQKNDQSYLSSAKKQIDSIMTIGYRPFFYKDMKKNYPEGTNISTMHNSTGIVALSSRQASSVVPYWSRKSLEKRVKAAKEDKKSKKGKNSTDSDQGKSSEVKE